MEQKPFFRFRLSRYFERVRVVETFRSLKIKFYFISRYSLFRRRNSVIRRPV